MVLLIEIILPWLILGPRRGRQVACAGFLLLMVLIGFTGNYNFFNLLTIVLAICSVQVRAEVRLEKVFTDHMVLQQEMPIAVWGHAEPGQMVTEEWRGKLLEGCPRSSSSAPSGG